MRVVCEVICILFILFFNLHKSELISVLHICAGDLKGFLVENCIIHITLRIFIIATAENANLIRGDKNEI